MDDERAANGGSAEEDDVRQKIRIMKTVLEMGGQFSGINRKVRGVAVACGAGLVSAAQICTSKACCALISWALLLERPGPIHKDEVKFPSGCDLFNVLDMQRMIQRAHLRAKAIEATPIFFT